jgi:Flp pilus assembly protein TadD
LLHGIAPARLPQIAEAAASFDSAAKLAPTLDEAWRNAGTAYQHLGQPDIAEGARAFLAKFSARC